MRQAGIIPNREQAQRLADYLLTQGISVRVEPEGDTWAIWARNEDQLAGCKDEIVAFLANPTAEKYNASQEAQSLRKQQARDDARRQKQYIELRDRWSGRRIGSCPLTLLLIAVSVVVMLATNGGENLSSKLLNALWFAPPPTPNMSLFELATWSPIKYIAAGQWWRLVTPIFIHFNMMHLVFNMYWLYVLGSMIEGLRGSWRFGLLVLLVAVASNYGEYFIPTHFGHRPSVDSTSFGGMSGVAYGLLGYVWMKARFQPQAGMYLAPFTVALMLGWLVLCFTGTMGPVANWAHTVGLVVGMAIGYAPVAWRKLAGH